MSAGAPLAHDRSMDLVRDCLQRILDSPQFRNSTRLARFLRVVVELTAEGKAEELKESVIGALVFDRPPDYDPKIDSIVRVQARQLRAKLQEYYSGAGSSDPVRIEIPKGSYAPVIRTTVAAEPERVVPIDRPDAPAVAHQLYSGDCHAYECYPCLS